MSKNICSACCGNTTSVNYAKQVDPPVQKYGTILGDAPQQGDFRRIPKAQAPCPQMCLPVSAECPPTHTQHQRSNIIQVPCDPIKPCPKFVCEPCPPSPPTKIWLIKSSPSPQKSFAIAQPPPCYPICNKPIIIPCPKQL